jgi:hypothetical protein
VDRQLRGTSIGAGRDPRRRPNRGGRSQRFGRVRRANGARIDALRRWTFGARPRPCGDHLRRRRPRGAASRAGRRARGPFAGRSGRRRRRNGQPGHLRSGATTTGSASAPEPRTMSCRSIRPRWTLPSPIAHRSGSASRTIARSTTLLLRRHRGHGSVMVELPALVPEALAELERPVGLGFRSDDGRLTHCLLGSMAGHHGPLTVEWLIYEEPHQLRDLLGPAAGARRPGAVGDDQPRAVRCAVAGAPRRADAPAIPGQLRSLSPPAAHPPGPRCSGACSIWPAVLRPALCPGSTSRSACGCTTRWSSGPAPPGRASAATTRCTSVRSRGVTDGLPTGSAPVLDASVGAFTGCGWVSGPPRASRSPTSSPGRPRYSLRSTWPFAYRRPSPIGRTEGSRPSRNTTR